MEIPSGNGLDFTVFNFVCKKFVQWMSIRTSHTYFIKYRVINMLNFTKFRYFLALEGFLTSKVIRWKGEYLKVLSDKAGFQIYQILYLRCKAALRCRIDDQKNFILIFGKVNFLTV